MRIDTLFTGRAVPVLIAGLVGAAALTGWLQSGLSPKQGDARSVDTERKPVPTSSCALCGTVESIRTVEVRDEAAGPGAGTGGPGGAGDQPVGGGGNAVTLLGAGGAIAGNEIEKNVKKRYAYRVTVRMDDGSFRTISLSSPPTFAVGDKVRVVEGKLVRT
jgi:outer membrane lipoprotein SlyB